MKILYLFTRTPNQENIRLLNKLVDGSDAVVFIQNGVYIDKQNFELKCQKFVLKSDAEARGLKGSSNFIEYSELIDLILMFDKVVTI